MPRTDTSVKQDKSTPIGAHSYKRVSSERLSIAAQYGELKKAAFDAFAEVVGIVGECQSLGELPQAPGATIALLLFATAHGLIAIEATGGLDPEKGLAGAAPGLEFLVQLLSQKA